MNRHLACAYAVKVKNRYEVLAENGDSEKEREIYRSNVFASTKVTTVLENVRKQQKPSGTLEKRREPMFAYRASSDKNRELSWTVCLSTYNVCMISEFPLFFLLRLAPRSL
jgi:hypothetical protein